MNAKRDSYVDFLRGAGLLLLVVAHTLPPEWLFQLRCFDVPMMVFVSALCYNSSINSYLQYFIKRVKRIYIPVLIFLTLFFILTAIFSVTYGETFFSVKQIIGSYLLLDNPSIGYVWIMRVFLMMALIMPLLEIIVKKLNIAWTIMFVFSLVTLQVYAVFLVEGISNKYIQFGLSQYVLYAFGYTPIAVIGLKLRHEKSIEALPIAMISGILIIIFLYFNDWIFNPQSFKYPPQFLYILYGILGCTLLWSPKHLISRFITFRGFRYLSENSMWIYLWHIIPVYIFMNYDFLPDLWLVRFCFVLAVSLILNILYQTFVHIFPKNIYIIIK